MSCTNHLSLRSSVIFEAMACCSFVLHCLQACSGYVHCVDSGFRLEFVVCFYHCLQAWERCFSVKASKFCAQCSQLAACAPSVIHASLWSPIPPSDIGRASCSDRCSSSSSLMLLILAKLHMICSSTVTAKSFITHGRNSRLVCCLCRHAVVKHVSPVAPLVLSV